MQGVLSALPEGSHVGVIRLRSLGDCVLTTPALHILKRTRPDLRIAVVVEDRFSPVFSGNPDIDRILPPSVAALRHWRPALTLNFHGGTRSLVMTRLSAARIRAGFAHHRGAANIYNVRIPTAQEILGVERKVHTAEHLASAVFYLGAPRIEIPRARLFASAVARPRPYGVIHPVAATPEKTWPAENFLAIARQLPFEAVFIGGPTDDLTAFTEFETATGNTLEQTKSLIAGASLFIGNDSGPAHIAAAFGIPQVVLFGPSDPVIWAPWRVESEVVHADPISAIRVDQVLAAVQRAATARERT